MTTAAAPTSATPTGTPPAPQDTQPKPQDTQPKPTGQQGPTGTQPKPPEGKKDDVGDLTSDDEGTDGSGAQATEIEVTVPEGVEVDKAMLDGFKGIAKDLKMDSKGAQKVLDFYVGHVKQAEEQIQSAWNEQKEKWRETASKDKEIGGANFKSNVELARKAIDKLGGSALKQALRDLDIGAHPEIIRAFVRVGKMISEDSLRDIGGSSASTGKDADEMLKKAFPSMFKTEEK